MTSDNPGPAAAAIRAKADADAARLAPIIAEIWAAGITTPWHITAELNRRRIRTARGNRWGDNQVRRLLVRLGKSH